jgi:hypothetical protein
MHTLSKAVLRSESDRELMKQSERLMRGFRGV